MMDRPFRQRAAAGAAAAALLVLVALSATPGPPSGVELDTGSKAAGFAQAAHSARSWAAQVFASAPRAAAVQAPPARQQVLATVADTKQQQHPAVTQRAAVSASLHTPTREPAVHVQQQLTVRQPRFESPAGEHPMDPRPRSARHQGDEHHGDEVRAGSTFFRDAVSELGQAPSAASLKKATQGQDLTFAAAAASELAPAPRLSTLRANPYNAVPRTSRQQQLAAMTVTPHSDVTAHVTEHGQAPAGFVGRQYSLARESREGAEQAAYDFARSFQNKRHIHSAPSPTTAAPHAPAAAAAPARKPRFDSFGIPFGAGEGVLVSRSSRVAAARRAQRLRREVGITGAQARSALGDYFTNLVAKAHDEKATYVRGTTAHYYQTRDAARQQSLAQVQGKSTEPGEEMGGKPYVGVVVTPTLDSVAFEPRTRTSEYKAAEENVGGAALARAKQALRRAAEARAGRKGGRGRVRASSSRVLREAQQQDAFQKRVDAAEAAIAKLTRKAEAAIVAAAHRTAAATEKKLEGRGKAGKGIREAIKDVDDAAAVVSTAQSARPSQRRQGRDERDHARDAPVHALPERRHGQHSLARHRGITAAEARADLFASMDDTFKKTSDVDELDRMRLKRRWHDPHTKATAVIRDLDQFARQERERDLRDEKNLRSPKSLSAAVNLRHQEQEQSQQEEAEYEDALKTALGKSSKGAPPLPLDPLPTHQ
jgi:hypothetical protein